MQHFELVITIPVDELVPRWSNAIFGGYVDEPEMVRVLYPY